MLAGFTLAIALGALLAAIVAILLALYAIGQIATHAKRLDTLEVQHAEMQGHRVRLDGNIAAIARHWRIPDGVVVMAKEPERPQ